MKLKRVARLQSGDAITSELIREAGHFPVYGGNGLRGYAEAFTHDGFFPLIGRQGALCGNINYARGRFWASEHAVVAEPSLGMHPRWLGELLRCMNLNQYSVSAAQPGLAVEKIGDLYVPVPSKGEQKSIADFINDETAKIDALVAEQKRLIELLKEKRQAVISHAVTKGLDPNVPMKGSRVEWLGNVPAHWLVGSLRWYAEIQGGIAKGKDHAGKDVIELPYLRVANVQNGYVDLSDVAEIAVLPHEADRYALRAGDVLMNEGGDNDKLGRGAVWRAEVEPCLHQNHVFAIRPSGHLLAEWLALFTSAEAARTYFYLHSKQSTNLASISSSNVMNCPIPLPGVGEQREILDSIERQAAAIDEMTAEAKKSSGLLAERRSALISAAVTGKIDVRDWEPPRSAEKTSREEAMETT